MDTNVDSESSKQGSSDQGVPSLLKFIGSKNVVGFDSTADTSSHETTPYRPSRFRKSGEEPENAAYNPSDETPPLMGYKPEHSVSISMPSSPFMHNNKAFADEPEPIPENGTFSVENNNKKKFHSQPMLKQSRSAEDAATASEINDKINLLPAFKRLNKDNRYDSFKTWSGKLEDQMASFRPGRPRGLDVDQDQHNSTDAIPTSRIEPLPRVERYYAALEGPELETLRPSEKCILPNDKKWPFLLRYPISTFGIILGVSSQAMLFKTLATSASTEFLHISLKVDLVLWCIAVILMIIISSIYLLKVIIYFEAVRREYYHPIRVNFFFAPWIALLFLAIGVPSSVVTELPKWLWYVLMTPIFCLELKIYGQWMSGGQRRLSQVANPSNHLCIVGNFVGALLGANMGLREGPLFFFAVGLAHYIVLFVTLYQRLPTNETLPKELHPVFFLFVAAPGVASMAWAKLTGTFDYGSRIAYFITLFLYLSLAVRVNFFRGIQFSLAWWAYTFPMTGAAIATIRYSVEVTNIVTRTFAVGLSAIATLTCIALLVTTVLHAFVFKQLFPNDMAIAISDKKPRKRPHHRHKKWFKHSKDGSDEDHSKDIENFLKFEDTKEGGEDHGKDLEATANAKKPSSSSSE
ncbi:hypothetical protein ACFE04_026850 [Oxalis oulophora]